MTQEKTVFMKCRKYLDKALPGQCPGTQAVVLPQSVKHASTFKCTVCGYVWSVQTGGNFEI